MLRNPTTIISVAAIATMASATLAAPTTQPATTQPITAGRDTPAGAMNIYERAIETGDVATVADSYNGGSELARLAIARNAVLEARFDKAVEARFGHAALLKLCDDCQMRPEPTDIKYTNDMWTLSPQRPDEAAGHWEPGQKTPATSFMQRDPDGIWRIGRYVSPEARHRATTRAAALRARLGLTTLPTNPCLAQANPVQAPMQRAVDGLNARKFKTVEELEAYLYPQGTPLARMRQMQQQERQQQAQAEKQQEQAILAYHFDPSTLQGAIGLFTQAAIRRDAKAMANLMFIPAAPDSVYPLASAQRLLAIAEFQQAAEDHIDASAAGLAAGFGLETDAAFTPSLAWDQAREHGDVGMITRGGEGQVAAWYRKMGGVWKQEIKLQLAPPRTLAGYTMDVQDDTAALQRLTADIRAGKLTTDAQLRDALGSAGFNCFSDPTFTLDFEHAYPSPNPIKPHDRPAHPPAPTDPKSPAGAMNRFIRAVETGDEKTVRDCLWLPNDHDGSAAAAMAHDYVVGARFSRALQKSSAAWDFHGWIFNVNGSCCAAGAIPPECLRIYSEDEWLVDPAHPDLAVSNNAIIARPDPPQQGQRQTYTMVHEWTPLMHRGPDGIWRLGPWYPQTTHQLQEQSTLLAAKDQILEKATNDLNANKIRSIDDLTNPVFVQLKAMGVRPVTTIQP